MRSEIFGDAEDFDLVVDGVDRMFSDNFDGALEMGEQPQAQVQPIPHPDPHQSRWLDARDVGRRPDQMTDELVLAEIGHAHCENRPLIERTAVVAKRNPC
jgi:hypothetical protein